MLFSYRPLRQLNDNRGIFGLHGSDFGIGVVVFVVISLFLDDTAFAILAVPGAALSLACLAPIRLMTRRGILRDTVSYFLSPASIQIGNRRSGR